MVFSEVGKRFPPPGLVESVDSNKQQKTQHRCDRPCMRCSKDAETEGSDAQGFQAQKKSSVLNVYNSTVHSDSTQLWSVKYCICKKEVQLP